MAPTMFMIDHSGERVGDITFWKDELSSEIHAMDNEIANLQVPLSKGFLLLLYCFSLVLSCSAKRRLSFLKSYILFAG